MSYYVLYHFQKVLKEIQNLIVGSRFVLGKETIFFFFWKGCLPNDLQTNITHDAISRKGRLSYFQNQQML